MITGAGFDVKCPSCGGRYHETSKHFNDQLLPKGHMFFLKIKYRGFGWDAFPERDNIKLADLRCPWCDGAYLLHNRIARLIDPQDDEMMNQGHPRRSPPRGNIEANMPEISSIASAVVIRAEGSEDSAKKSGPKKKRKR